MNSNNLDRLLLLFETDHAINESILDEPREGLNTNIWEDPNGTPNLRKDVAEQVLSGLGELVEDAPLKDVYVVGSITGYRYNEEADLDITVVLDDVDDETLDQIRSKAPRINGRFVEGTTHPINYFVLGETPPMERFDSAYDLKNRKWLKDPKDYGVDVSNVYDEFKGYIKDIDAKSSEAMRSLVDIELLTKAVENSVNVDNIKTKINDKLAVLDDAIDGLASDYDEVHKERVEAFKNYEDSSEKILPSANLLPENVRYKLLERYHYLDLMKKISDLVKETGSIDTPEDVKKVKEIIKSEPIEESVSEKSIWDNAIEDFCYNVNRKCNIIK